MHITCKLFQKSDCRVWTLDSFGKYIWKSFFYHITKYLACYHSTFTRTFWQAKVHSKVKTFAWIAILNTLNTYELLQIRRPNYALSPDICVMCYPSREIHNHLFLHCEMAQRLCCKLFDTFNLSWVAPPSLDCFLSSSIGGFGIRVKAGPSWKEHFSQGYGLFGWKERQFFYNQSIPDSILWENMTFLAAL